MKFASAQAQKFYWHSIKYVRNTESHSVIWISFRSFRKAVKDFVYIRQPHLGSSLDAGPAWRSTDSGVVPQGYTEGNYRTDTCKTLV
jgi:hypothetical protein